jgi:hypothetical protein
LSGSFEWEGKDSGSRVSPGSTKVCVAISAAKKGRKMLIFLVAMRLFFSLAKVVGSLCPASAQTKNGASEISRLWDEKKFEIAKVKKEKIRYSCQHPRLDFAKDIEIEDTMAAEGASINGTTPAERHAIGISFGNSNSSIAYTTTEDKAEVIANEDGGMYSLYYEGAVNGS